MLVALLLELALFRHGRQSRLLSVGIVLHLCLFNPF